MLTVLKDVILKYPIILSPFHPSTIPQTIAGLLSSAFIGINILVITDNKADIDTAAGVKISDDMIKTYNAAKLLPYTPDILIIVDDILTFQNCKLDIKFKSKRNNLIFMSSLKVQNENYKSLFDCFPDMKKININLLNSYPVIKINKYNLTVNNDLYTKYKQQDNNFWYNLLFYETDNLNNFTCDKSNKLKLLLTKLILGATSKHILYLSSNIYCGLDNLANICRVIGINHHVANDGNNAIYSDKNFKGVILTSTIPNTDNITNVNGIHFIGSVDYKVYSELLEKIHQVKNYDNITPTIEVNFYLTSFSEDGHVSPELHQYHFLERELKSSLEAFYPDVEIQSDLCWKNESKFVFCSSN